MIPINRCGPATIGAVAALTALLLTSGCGSGGSSSQISNCSLDTFVPNYARHVDNLLQWASFPVTIFFIRDANYSQGRQNTAITGFDQWVAATNSAITYQVVTASSGADITVKFDPSTANGLTELHFAGFQMHEADISIGVQNLAAVDIQCVAAHEFGHALGINGHSDAAGDLMFPVHVVGDPCPITTRDLNTMKTAYCNVFTRAGRIRPREIGPIQTVQIH
jgi:hypothetical protein